MSRSYSSCDHSIVILFSKSHFTFLLNSLFSIAVLMLPSPNSLLTLGQFWLSSESKFWEDFEVLNLKQASNDKVSILVHPIQLEALLELTGI